MKSSLLRPGRLDFIFSVNFYIFGHPDPSFLAPGYVFFLSSSSDVPLQNCYLTDRINQITVSLLPLSSQQMQDMPSKLLQ